MTVEITYTPDQIIGKRILGYFNHTAGIKEYKVLEFSPCNNFVKLKDDITGQKLWFASKTLKLVSILKEIKQLTCETCTYREAVSDYLDKFKCKVNNRLVYLKGYCHEYRAGLKEN